MIAVGATWAALTLAAILIHLVADWFFQNDWMAKNKAKRWVTTIMEANYRWETGESGAPGRWWLRHPAAYVHAGIHGVCLLLVFPWWAALIVAILHLIIDTRSPLEYWGKFTRQTRRRDWEYIHDLPESMTKVALPPEVMDIGMEVAFWRDQVAHFVVIALVALFV